MKNEKSYSESVKSLSMSEMKNDAVVQEMLIDMIIQEAVLTTKRISLQNRSMKPWI